MSLIEHLTELRSRLIKAFIAIAVGMLVGFIAYEWIFDFLLDPYLQVADPGQAGLFVQDPLEGFSVRLKVSAYAGVALAMPVILWQLWRALPAFRGDADAGTWLYRVALNTALTWKRRGERRDTTALLHERRPDASHGAPRSEAALLEEFLATLGDLDRSILLLYLEGLAYQAIADVTGIAAGTVGVRLHRIKRTFHDRYMED